MKKEMLDALKKVTKGLSNPQYFEETQPVDYDVSAYCISCGTEPSDRKLEREWTSIVLPRLKASNVKVLQEAATRLERKWKSQKRTRQAERSEEEEENRMRKLLIRAKYEHRSATLDHSSSTLARDFRDFDRSSITKNTPLLQDIILSSLRDGCSLPPWAKDRPLYKFKLRLREEWGARVTELYESAKRKPFLDHTHVDEIALLSGIVHLNKRHVGFSEQEIKAITASVLEMFYSHEMKEQDIQRAQDAVLLWSSWQWKRLLMNEKIAAQRENRDPVEAIDTEPVVDAILSSYAECKGKKITPVLFIALHAFRQYNSWATLVSESDCLMGVVGPILKEVMAFQHEINANACTSVGKTRKAQLKQDGQSRQPDVIGLTEAKDEIFYGEVKGPAPKTADVNTDILRLAVFSKDSLDQVHNLVEEGPPLVTFLAGSRDVTFFLAAKVDNTIVHLQLSTVRLPADLKEMDLRV
ncbi:hypothetical protein EC968_005602 [Mortierella alpina]|nr:hypothetical protein EC968_005602 [Mortierella alpina]